MPVSISLGLWATLITYLVSIPLGIRKAVHHGSHFDIWSSTAIIIGYAMPAFLFAMLLVVVFAGGTSLNWFPVRGLVSDNFDSLSTLGKIADYFWHLVLPVTAGDRRLRDADDPDQELVSQRNHPPIRGHRPSQRVERTPRALRTRVPQRDAALVVSGIPQAFISVFFAGSLLIEVIFSLDGLGRMSYEAAVSRDYPVVFGSLFIFTLFGLLIKLVGDICYTLVDPRIDFSARNA
jgi:microcin C transport system permease protein